MLNLIGLVLVTIGALLAIFSAPGPIYNRDGTVSLGPGGTTINSRIRKHFLQKFALPASFGMIAIGSGMQLFVAWSQL